MPSDTHETIELIVSDIVYPGRGLARHDELVIFIEGVIAGERIRARITHRHKRFAEARLVEVIEPSPARTQPVCPLALSAEQQTGSAALVCPGCAYQHMHYDEELRCKNAQLDTLIERLGGGPAEGDPLEPVPAPQPYGYRNKIVLHTDSVTGSPCRLGYIGTDNQTVIPITACPLACPNINERLTHVLEDQHLLRRLKPKTDVTLRNTDADGVHVWTGKRPATLKWLTETTALGNLRTPLTGFYQVNPPVANLLLGAVQEHIRQAAPQAVVDLYCGSGLFSIAAAQCGVPAVLGIDIHAPSIRAARLNASTRSLEHVDFACARAEQVLEQALKPVPASDTLLILDPPRRGLERPVTDALAQQGPARILYLSCAPDTLARDLRILRQSGYMIESRCVYDMFPRTAHFESLLSLHRPV